MSGRTDNIISYRQGKVELQARYLWAGQDLLILASGGDVPHIGAVCLADGQGASQTAVYPGHREDEMAQSMALEVSRRLGCKVVVAAGMHWRGFNLQLLEEIKDAWLEMTRRLLKQLEK